MSRLPLAGRTVVVTRSRAQSAGLVTRLEHLGATVVALPVIAIETPADGGAALGEAVTRLRDGAYEWVALTSSNAAGRLLAAIGDRPVPGPVRWAAVGTGTASTLAEGGIVADLVPAVSQAESLADAFPTPGSGSPSPAGAPGSAGTVLFPRAETVRSGLAAGLRAKGWEVDEVVAYRTVPGDPDSEAVTAAGQADAVAFTSSSTVERTVDLLGPRGLPPVVVTIGPVTSSSARAAGLDVAAEADPHTLDGLVAVLVEVLGAPRGGRSEPGPLAPLP